MLLLAIRSFPRARPNARGTKQLLLISRATQRNNGKRKSMQFSLEANASKQPQRSKSERRSKRKARRGGYISASESVMNLSP